MSIPGSPTVLIMSGSVSLYLFPSAAGEAALMVTEEGSDCRPDQSPQCLFLKEKFVLGSLDTG